MLNPDLRTLWTAVELPLIADFMRNVFPGWIHNVDDKQQWDNHYGRLSSFDSDMLFRLPFFLRTSSFSSSLQKGSRANMSFRTEARCSFSVMSWFPYWSKMHILAERSISKIMHRLRYVVDRCKIEWWPLCTVCRGISFKLHMTRSWRIC